MPTNGIHRVYKVGKVQGDWLWLREEGESPQKSRPGDKYCVGWVKRDKVVNLDKAVEYFSDAIRRNPSPYAFRARGIIWEDLQNLDMAIVDFSKAIRLDPNQSISYEYRGNAQFKRKDYDQAIADYDQSIRLRSRRLI